MKRITVFNSNVEVAILGLPPMETFKLTARALFDWNAGRGHPCRSADRWLRSLRDGQPVTWADIRNALPRKP